MGVILDTVPRKIRVAAEKLRVVPEFETAAVVTDDAVLAAEISSLFQRANRYLVVLDPPRMTRDDAHHEVIRRRNSLSRCAAKPIILAKCSDQIVRAISLGGGSFVRVDNLQEAEASMKGRVKRRKAALHWGASNLGVGLYIARQENKQLVCDLESSPSTSVVDRGRHLIVVCERGNDLSEVIASNFAFSVNASFATFPKLPDEDREQWIEDLYRLGESASASRDVDLVATRARDHLHSIDLSAYATVLWVTGGFPWGIAFPGIPSSHINNYPDFGRIVTDSIYSARTPSVGNRTALLIDPGTVGADEVPLINKALLQNGCLTNVLRNSAAKLLDVQFSVELLPYEIIVLSSHAGDAAGSRLTYEYQDYEGRLRRLVVDEALSAAYDKVSDKVQVTIYNRFHSLDGVDWHDRVEKSKMDIGTAMRAWADMAEKQENRSNIVSSEALARVNGSMGIQLYDHIWFFAPNGFCPSVSPLIFNNSCWSWHEISERVMFAGARGYIGAIRPIIGPEAQMVSNGLFEKYLGLPLAISLWAAHRDAQEEPSRYPFVMVGLPFISLNKNMEDAVQFYEDEIINGIKFWSGAAKRPQQEEFQAIARRNAEFLARQHAEFKRNLIRRARPTNGIPTAYS